VIVYTGAERNAGTSSDVTIRLIGNNGITEPHILKSKSDCQNDFLSDKVRAPRMHPSCSSTRPRPNKKAGLARNTVRSFLLGTDQNIGTLTGVRIWHDCRGKSPEWYLHRITVENLSNGEVFWFLCERWLAGFSYSAYMIRYPIRRTGLKTV